MTEPVRRISTRGLVVVLIVLGLFFYAVREVLLPFVIAGGVAYASSPLVNWLAARTRLPRAVPALLLFFCYVGLLALVGYLAIPSLVGEIIGIGSDLQGSIEGAIRQMIGDRTITFLGQSMNAGQMAAQAVEALRGWIGETGRVLTLATLSFASVFGVFLTLVLLLYMLLGGPRIGRGLFWLVPPRQRPMAHHLWSRIDPALKHYFLGLAVVVAFASSAAYIGLALVLGLPHAILLAILTGFLELVPVIGPLSSAVIAGLVAIQSATSLWNIVAYAAYAAALRLLIDQLVGPLVLGRAARIHPVLVIFCFLTGALLFGIVGVILAVPTALVIKTVLATLYGEPESDGPEPPAAPGIEADVNGGRR